MISPGGGRLYVGMSGIPGPQGLRGGGSFPFRFRNLAEGSQAREKVAAAEPARQEASAAAAAGADGEPARPDAGSDADAPAGASAAGALDASRRRPVLALRYCAPGDLLRQAAQVVAAERPEDDRALAIDVANPI